MYLENIRKLQMNLIFKEVTIYMPDFASIQWNMQQADRIVDQIRWGYRSLKLKNYVWNIRNIRIKKSFIHELCLIDY